MTETERQAALAAAPDIAGQEVTLPPPSGVCYIKLLHHVPEEAFSGQENNMATKSGGDSFAVWACSVFTLEGVQFTSPLAPFTHTLMYKHTHAHTHIFSRTHIRKTTKDLTLCCLLQVTRSL